MVFVKLVLASFAVDYYLTSNLDGPFEAFSRFKLWLSYKSESNNVLGDIFLFLHDIFTCKYCLAFYTSLFFVSFLILVYLVPQAMMLIDVFAVTGGVLLIFKILDIFEGFSMIMAVDVE